MKKVLIGIVMLFNLARGEYMNTDAYKGNVAQITVDRYYEVEVAIYYASDYYSVPSWIISSVLFIESKFNDDAVSWTGVKGISMITTSTAKHFKIDKSTVEGQIGGTSKILGHHYKNLPEYYSDEEKWTLSAIFYNGGKRDYWKAKKYYKSIGVTGSRITIERILRFYRTETRDYHRKVLKTKPMFI